MLLQEEGEEAENVGEYGDPDNVYPFGVDPAWHIAGNELLFFNSMKMKTSVILGVTQMTFGVCLKAMNALYFKESLDFFYEFIPMIVFVLSLFGCALVTSWSCVFFHRDLFAVVFEVLCCVAIVVSCSSFFVQAENRLATPFVQIDITAVVRCWGAHTFLTFRALPTRMHRPIKSNRKTQVHDRPDLHEVVHQLGGAHVLGHVLRRLYTAELGMRRNQHDRRNVSPRLWRLGGRLPAAQPHHLAHQHRARPGYRRRAHVRWPGRRPGENRNRVYIAAAVLLFMVFACGCS